MIILSTIRPVHALRIFVSTTTPPSLGHARTGTMARFRHVIDMGMYSPLHKQLHDRLYDQDQQAEGPVAGHTRSQTKQSNASSLRKPFNPSPTLRSTTITKRRAPSIGTLPQTRISKRTLARADNKLRRMRLKLKKYLDPATASAPGTAISALQRAIRSAN
jgi:hypothetical protein